MTVGARRPTVNSGSCRAATVLLVSPHPDDELLGAPATAMALRDAGWRVVNLACGLGRRVDRERRRGELTEACRRAGFELVIPDRTPPIGRDDDLDAAQVELSATIAVQVQETGAELIIGPSPHDGHHGHEVVGRAIRDAVEGRSQPLSVMFWGLWADLPFPNVLVVFDGDRLAEIEHALGAHEGELDRNRFDRLLRGRAVANAVLGPERVFGYGASRVAGGADRVAGEPAEYAELLCEVQWTPGPGWRIGPPRLFEPSATGADRPRDTGAGAGADLGWWLHSTSVATRMREVAKPG